MGYKYWGYIAKHGDETWKEKRYPGGPVKPIDPNKLSEEFKTKIAMMDFMKDDERLPCGSHKAHCSYLGFLAYYLYAEVSSAREEE